MSLRIIEFTNISYINKSMEVLKITVLSNIIKAKWNIFNTLQDLSYYNIMLVIWQIMITGYYNNKTYYKIYPI